MEELIVGVVAGWVLRGLASNRSRRSVRGPDAIGQMLNGWFNRRRHTKLRAKAEKRGLVELYDEECHDFLHLPYSEQNPWSCVRAFRRAQQRQAAALATRS